MATTTTDDLQPIKDALLAFQKAAVGVSSSTALSKIGTIKTASDVSNTVDALASLLGTLLNFQGASDALATSLRSFSGITSTAQQALISTVKDITGVTVSAPASFSNCEQDQFQGMRFYDGTSFGYLRVFADKVQLLVDQPFEFAIDGTKMHTYRLTGRNGNLKLYIDGQLAIDASGKFNQPTATKLIEFGDIAGRNQSIASFWSAFKYTTTGAFPPANTEDLLLEETIGFPQASIGRMKSYSEGMYVSVDPVDPDKSSSIYRFEEGKLPEHRSVLAVTKSSASAVVIDPNRVSSIFDTTGKYIGTDKGLQLIVGSKPSPFDFMTSFGQPLDGEGWTLDDSCEGSCDSLVGDVLTIDTTGEIDPRIHRYVQNLPSDSWVVNADNASGWTIEVKVKIIDDGSGNSFNSKTAVVAGSDTVECGTAAGGPDGTPPPDDSIYAPGIYVNDGKYQEFVQFFANGVRLKYARLFGSQKLSDQFYTVRIIAKGKAVAIFARGDGDAVFKRVLFSSNALGVTARTSAAQERPDLISDSAGVIHAVWQEFGLSGIGVFYSRLNHSTVTSGSGLIGRKNFDPSNNLISTRSGLGLPPVSDIDFSKISQNSLIAPLGTFVTDGVSPGDILQISENGTSIKYDVRSVQSEVLITLDTTDDLSLIGPADWLIVSGQTVWSPSVRVTDESFDSENPRMIQHSSGAAYVVYDNNQTGNTQIYVRQGVVTNKGVNFSKVAQITSSSHVARTPDIAELADGTMIVVWQDDTIDATGSQIFCTVISQTMGAAAPITSITPSGSRARNPKVSASNGNILVTYEDDSVQQGKFEVFAVTGSRTATATAFGTPVKISSGAGSAQNSSQIFGIAAWDETFPDRNTDIVYSAQTSFASNAWAAPVRITDSIGNSKRPVVVAGPAPAVATFIYESDRTRPGYFDLYASAISTLRDGTHLVSASAGVGLDTKFKTYLTGSSRASAVLTADNQIAVVWEGRTSNKQQSIYGTTYDGVSSSMDETVRAYFPLNERSGTSVSNRILTFDVDGFVRPPIDGASFHAADVYSVPAAKPGLSLFGPDDDFAFDLRAIGGDGLNGGFSFPTDPLIGRSGAIDMFVTPNWPSSSIDQHVFFGNGPLDPTATQIPNTMVFGVGPAMVGNVMRFRIVDKDGNPHETIVDNPLFWNVGDTVHLRAIWDSTNIGASSIFGMTFSSASIGYACGANGSVFKTTNGGASWVKQVTGISYDLYGIDFISDTSGWACGELGTVLVTTDGGASWTIIDSGVTADLKSIYFKDSLNGYACGSAGTIISSTNGGLIWAIVNTGAANDFNAISAFSSGVLIAVGRKGQVYVSNDGITWTSNPINDAGGNPFRVSLNAISRTHQGGSYNTYIVGNSGTIIRTTDNGGSYQDLSAVGPNSDAPDLLCVSHGSNSSNVWIPWGVDGIAYSTASADSGSLVFVDSLLNGAYRAVEANFGASSSGAKVAVSGIGGTLLTSPDFGATQTLGQTKCANLSIFVNGKEAIQHRNADCAFSWNPTGSIFVGDFKQASRLAAGIPGSTAADSIIDEVVVYSTPTPGSSAFNRHEFKSVQISSATITGDDTGKRLEFGSISPFVKTKTQWSEFNLFYCGAIEPLQLFAWDSTCGLIDDVVMDLSLDHSGSLWIATANGISSFDINVASEVISDYLTAQAQPKLDAPLFTSYNGLANGLPTDEIVSIAADENDDIWAATPKGLYLYERSATKATASLADPVDTIKPDTTGTLQNGTAIPASAQFKKFSGLPSDNILVVRSLNGAIFVGTDKGLVVVNRPKKTADPVADTNKASSAATNTTASNSVSTDTTSTTVSVGSTDLALFTTKDGLPSNRIQAIAQASSGAVWLGTDNGLVLFKGVDSVVYSTNSGLISRDVTSITIDGRNRVFVGTGFGLTVINGSKFTTFPPSSGIGPGAINGGAQDSSGVFWFATSNGLVEAKEGCGTSVRFTTYGIEDGIIGDGRIVDYLRYRILGGPIPTGGCEKALVTVAVNGSQLSGGFSVDPFVPWIVFDQPLSSSDVVDVCVQRGWRKVHDFNFDKNSNTVSQTMIETNKSKYSLFRKRMAAGPVSLGGNFQQGASNNSTMQYSVFAVPLPGLTGPVIGAIDKPASAVRLSTVSVGDALYADALDSITNLPQELITAEHIALSVADASDISSDYLDFNLLVDSIVYVAYDSRSGSLPAWLREFDPVPVLIRVSDLEVFTDSTQQEKLFVATSGSNGCVYDILHAPEVCDISEQIAIDVTPPAGCATISKVNSKTSFTLALQASDAVTGVADMQIAPRQDGTIDGVNPSPFVPFQTNYTFNLPPAASATTGDVAGLPTDVVAGGTAVPAPAGIVNNIFHDFLGTLLVGTKNPGRVYKFDKSTSVLSLLFDTGEAEVLSMATFGKNLIVGTGINGKTFQWDGTTLSQLPLAVGQRVTSAAVFANTVFLGYSPGGQIYTLDQFGVMQLFMQTFETAITDFAIFAGKLYWSTGNETLTSGETLSTTTTLAHKHFFIVPLGTTALSGANGMTSPAPDGHVHLIINGIIQPANNHTHGLNGSRSGKIFRYDQASGQSIIVHADTDYQVNSLVSSSTDASGILFAGTTPHGKILRFIPQEEIFIKSFQTTGMTVNRLRFFSQVYAMVDNNIYSFTGTHWEFIASVTDSARDIAPDTSSSASTKNQILVLRDQNVASTSAAPSLLNPNICAYVRFRDVAGNVSSVVDSSGNLVKCYSPCIDLTATGTGGTGGGTTPGLTIGKNRILEVDQFARVVLGLDGSEAFLSGNKVEEEVAVYFSEIFNGTNSFVQWTALDWNATTPLGTSITLAVRSADSSAAIASALWGPELTNPTFNDLTNLTGQFLQFRATLKTFVLGAPSPVLHSVHIGLRTSQAVHYFTTNFVLPDELRRGILTYNGCVNPPVTDVVFGITGLDSTDFSDYFPISPDKVFELPSEQQTKNLRVGIKLISSPTEVPIVDEFALLVSLANDAKIKLNLVGQPASTSGQLAPTTGTRTVITERVQNHTHTITFDATILDQSNINGTTSINAGHSHAIINGVVQQSAGHTHNFSI